MRQLKSNRFIMYVGKTLSVCGIKIFLLFVKSNQRHASHCSACTEIVHQMRGLIKSMKGPGKSSKAFYLALPFISFLILRKNVFRD